MNTETLEALLADRALGALTPEVAELLDAHLARDPEAAQQAAALDATVRLARETVACAGSPLPASLPAARWREQAAVQRGHARAWELSRLAAAVLLGLSLGWTVRTDGSRPREAKSPAPSEAVRGSLAADRPGSAHGFWTLASFTESQQTRPNPDGRPMAGYHLHWESPVKMPHVEGNL